MGTDPVLNMRQLSYKGHYLLRRFVLLWLSLDRAYLTFRLQFFSHFHSNVFRRALVDKYGHTLFLVIYKFALLLNICLILVLFCADQGLILVLRSDVFVMMAYHIDPLEHGRRCECLRLLVHIGRDHRLNRLIFWILGSRMLAR